MKTHDVVVCCMQRGRPQEILSFPAVRASCLAKYLGRLGVDAVFRTLPCPQLRCRTLIISEYQPDDEYLAWLLPEISALGAERFYYITNTGISDSLPQRCKATRWFCDRGGILVHLLSSALGPGETHIGVGVDLDEVSYDSGASRNGVLFDYPGQMSDVFDEGFFRSVRELLPHVRFVGSGPPIANIKKYFDDWWDYGQSHISFIRVYRGCAAFIPGWPESMGMAVAEAQLNGACVLSPFGWVKREMFCPSAKIMCVRDPVCLAEAINYSLEANPADIVAEARRQFDPLAMAQRTLLAIGATAGQEARA